MKGMTNVAQFHHPSQNIACTEYMVSGFTFIVLRPAGIGVFPELWFKAEVPPDLVSEIVRFFFYLDRSKINVVESVDFDGNTISVYAKRDC